MAETGSDSNLKPTDNHSDTDTDLETISTEELVMFESTQPFYSNKNDITVIYSLGQSLESTPKDWIGLFKQGWQTSYDFSAYQWTSQEPVNPWQSEQRKSIFPQADIGHLHGDFQFLYVTSDAQVVGVSESFRVSDVDKHPESPMLMRQDVPGSLSLISLGSTISSSSEDEPSGKRRPPTPEAVFPLLEAANEKSLLLAEALIEERSGDGVGDRPLETSAKGAEAPKEAPTASQDTFSARPEGPVELKAQIEAACKKLSFKKKVRKDTSFSADVAGKDTRKTGGADHTSVMSYADALKRKPRSFSIGRSKKAKKQKAAEPPLPPHEESNKSCNKAVPDESEQVQFAGQNKDNSAEDQNIVMTEEITDIVAAVTAEDKWSLSDFLIDSTTGLHNKLSFVQFLDPRSYYEEYEPLKQFYHGMKQKLIEDMDPTDIKPPDSEQEGKNLATSSDTAREQQEKKLTLSSEIVLYQQRSSTEAPEVQRVSLPSSDLYPTLQEAFHQCCLELYKKRLLESAMEEEQAILPSPPCTVVRGWKTLDEDGHFPVWVLPVFDLAVDKLRCESKGQPDGEDGKQPAEEKKATKFDSNDELHAENDRDVPMVQKAKLFKLPSSLTFKKKEREDGKYDDVEKSVASSGNGSIRKGPGISFISSRLKNLRKKRIVKSSKSERIRGNKEAMLQEALALIPHSHLSDVNSKQQHELTFSQDNALKIVELTTSNPEEESLIIKVTTRKRHTLPNILSKTKRRRTSTARTSTPEPHQAAPHDEGYVSSNEKNDGDTITAISAEERLELLNLALIEALKNNAELGAELRDTTERMSIKCENADSSTTCTKSTRLSKADKEIGNSILCQRSTVLCKSAVNQTGRPKRKTAVVQTLVVTKDTQSQASVDKKDSPTQCIQALTTGRATNTDLYLKNASSNTTVVMKKDTQSQCSRAKTVGKSTNTVPVPASKDAENNTPVIHQTESSVQCNARFTSDVAIATSNDQTKHKETLLMKIASSRSSTALSSITDSEQSSLDRWKEVCSRRMLKLKRIVSRKREEFMRLRENAANFERKSLTLECQLRSVRSLLSEETLKRLNAEKELHEMRVRFWELLANRQTQPWNTLRQANSGPVSEGLVVETESKPHSEIEVAVGGPTCRDYFTFSHLPVLTITPFPPPPPPPHEDIERSESADQHYSEQELAAKFCSCGETHNVGLAFKFLEAAKQAKTPAEENDSKIKEKKIKTGKTGKKLRPTSDADKPKTSETASVATPRPKKKLQAVAEEDKTVDKKVVSSAMSFKKFLMPAMAAIAETFGATRPRISKLSNSGSDAGVNCDVTNPRRLNVRSSTSSPSKAASKVFKYSKARKSKTYSEGRKKAKLDVCSVTLDDDDCGLPSPSNSDASLNQVQVKAIEALCHPRTQEKVKMFAGPLDLSLAKPVKSPVSRTRRLIALADRDLPDTMPDHSDVFPQLTDNFFLAERPELGPFPTPSEASTESVGNSERVLAGCAKVDNSKCAPAAREGRQFSYADVAAGKVKQRTETYIDSEIGELINVSEANHDVSPGLVDATHVSTVSDVIAAPADVVSGPTPFGVSFASTADVSAAATLPDVIAVRTTTDVRSDSTPACRRRDDADEDTGAEATDLSAALVPYVKHCTAVLSSPLSCTSATTNTPSLFAFPFFSESPATTFSVTNPLFTSVPVTSSPTNMAVVLAQPFTFLPPPLPLPHTFSSPPPPPPLQCTRTFAQIESPPNKDIRSKPVIIVEPQRSLSDDVNMEPLDVIREPLDVIREPLALPLELVGRVSEKRRCSGNCGQMEENGQFEDPNFIQLTEEDDVIPMASPNHKPIAKVGSLTTGGKSSQCDMIEDGELEVVDVIPAVNDGDCIPAVTGSYVLATTNKTDVIRMAKACDIIVVTSECDVITMTTNDDDVTDIVHENVISTEDKDGLPLTNQVTTETNKCKATTMKYENDENEIVPTAHENDIIPMRNESGVIPMANNSDVIPLAQEAVVISVAQENEIISKANENYVIPKSNETNKIPMTNESETPIKNTHLNSPDVANAAEESVVAILAAAAPVDTSDFMKALDSAAESEVEQVLYDIFKFPIQETTADCYSAESQYGTMPTHQSKESSPVSKLSGSTETTPHISYPFTLTVERNLWPQATTEVDQQAGPQKYAAVFEDLGSQVKQSTFQEIPNHPMIFPTIQTSPWLASCLGIIATSQQVPELAPVTQATDSSLQNVPEPQSAVQHPFQAVQERQAQQTATAQTPVNTTLCESSELSPSQRMQTTRSPQTAPASPTVSCQDTTHSKPLTSLSTLLPPPLSLHPASLSPFVHQFLSSSLMAPEAFNQQPGVPHVNSSCREISCPGCPNSKNVKQVHPFLKNCQQASQSLDGSSASPFLFASQAFPFQMAAPQPVYYAPQKDRHSVSLQTSSLKPVVGFDPPVGSAVNPPVLSPRPNPAFQSNPPRINPPVLAARVCSPSLAPRINPFPYVPHINPLMFAPPTRLSSSIPYSAPTFAPHSCPPTILHGPSPRTDTRRRSNPPSPFSQHNALSPRSAEALKVAQQLSVHGAKLRQEVGALDKKMSCALHCGLDKACSDPVGRQMRRGKCLTCGMKFSPAVDRYLMEEHLFFHNAFTL